MGKKKPMDGNVVVSWKSKWRKRVGGLLKGALLGLRQFLATESPLKMMNNAFYFTSKALFVPKIMKHLSWLYGHVEKRLD